MASRGRPVADKTDSGYTQRQMALAIRCRELHERFASLADSADLTNDQRFMLVIGRGNWGLYLGTQSWDKRQAYLRRSADAYVEFENSLPKPLDNA